MSQGLCIILCTLYIIQGDVGLYMLAALGAPPGPLVHIREVLPPEPQTWQVINAPQPAAEVWRAHRESICTHPPTHLPTHTPTPLMPLSDPSAKVSIKSKPACLTESDVPYEHHRVQPHRFDKWCLLHCHQRPDPSQDSPGQLGR